jgi:hypothetical protein
MPKGKDYKSKNTKNMSTPATRTMAADVFNRGPKKSPTPPKRPKR